MWALLPFCRCGDTHLGGKKSATGIDVVHQIVALHFGANRWGRADCTGVVYADIQAAKSFDCLIDRGLDLLFKADIADQCQCLATSGFDLFGRCVDRARQLGVRFGGLCSDGHVGTISRTTLGDSEANTAARAGDKKLFFPARLISCCPCSVCLRWKGEESFLSEIRPWLYACFVRVGDPACNRIRATELAGLPGLHAIQRRPEPSQ
jgi:hypothetical protein